MLFYYSKKFIRTPEVSLQRKARREVLPQHDPQRGFTLTEVLITVFLMTVLLGIGALSMTKNNNAQGLNAAITMVESLVFEARDLAIKSGNKTRLVINNQEEDSGYRKELVIALDDGTGDYTATGRSIMLPDSVYIDTRRANAKTAGVSSIGNLCADINVTYTAGVGFPNNVAVEFNSAGICIDSVAYDQAVTAGTALPLTGAEIPLFKFPDPANIPTGGTAQDAVVVVWRNGSTTKITDSSLVNP